MFRAPAATLTIDVARQYLGLGYRTWVRAYGEHLILELRDEDETGDHDDG